jgi:Tol biopolymer transport system component
VNLGPGNTQSNWSADLPEEGRFVSADGRYVVFRSYAADLVPNDTNWAWDIFVRDRARQTVERVSVDSAGMESNGDSGLVGISMSSDGRYVVFFSGATNLVPGGSSGAQIFLRDRLLGTTELISQSAAGIHGNSLSGDATVSDDGRFVAFHSAASNLVAGDTNAHEDIFVRDRLSGTTELVSVGLSGAPATGDSFYTSITPDGRFVAFASYASNLVLGDTNGKADVFVRDRFAGTTERVSVSSTGQQGDLPSGGWPILSADGRFVAFISAATNLVPGDTNANWDVFVRDRQAGTTERINLSSTGAQSMGGASYTSISADGRFVAFASNAQDLVFPSGGGTNIFIRDRQSGTIELASVSTHGGFSNGASGMPSLSSNGRFVAFRTYATNLVPDDTNGLLDVLVHDRNSTGFTSLCDPGANGVIACPCSNPPAAVGRGCENSAGTGGASLAASGMAYLALDNLVFSTSGELPSVTSILLQGDAILPNGTAFGQGVRCAGGLLTRLYVKSAANGSITAPDLAAGDPTVSARSAALGSPLQPGEPYVYFVYYRDPGVMGGCSPSATFNATQSGSISWWP